MALLILNPKDHKPFLEYIESAKARCTDCNFRLYKDETITLTGSLFYYCPGCANKRGLI